MLHSGFITVFVAACLLAPLFALLNDRVEIRLDARKFGRERRRPVAECAQDIGIWFHILAAITRLAVIGNVSARGPPGVGECPRGRAVPGGAGRAGPGGAGRGGARGLASRPGLPAGFLVRLAAARLPPVEPRPQPARLRQLHAGARPARFCRPAPPHVQLRRCRGRGSYREGRGWEGLAPLASRLRGLSSRGAALREGS